jgi:hypothetical protein
MLPAPADPFWLALLAKMAASAAIVVAASVAAERAGPFLGAMIATLPISAGPAFVFLAIDHGPAFLEASARASLPVFAATPLFVAAYAGLAQRRGVLISASGALLAWLVAALAVRQAEWGIGAALALNAAASACGIAATAAYRTASARGAVRKLWDIPFRAAVVMSVVAGVVIAGRALGPEAAGVTAVLPVVFVSLALVLQARIGGPAVAAMMASGLFGLIGFVAALAVLAATATRLGSAAALSLALAICVAWNLSMIGARRQLARRSAHAR